GETGAKPLASPQMAKSIAFFDGISRILRINRMGEGAVSSRFQPETPPPSDIVRLAFRPVDPPDPVILSNPRFALTPGSSRHSVRNLRGVFGRCWAPVSLPTGSVKLPSRRYHGGFTPVVGDAGGEDAPARLL